MPQVPIGARDSTLGERQYLVTIQGYVDAVDGSGFPVETFVDLATVWAARTPGLSTRGGELLHEDQITGRSYHRWSIPYLEAVDPDRVATVKMRLVYEGRVYDVLEAQTIGPRVEILLTTMVKAT